MNHLDSIPCTYNPINPKHGGSIPRSELNKNDVLCGRGGCVNTYPGNIQFRFLVGQKKVRDAYNESKKKSKMKVAMKIIHRIRNMNPPGRFLEEDKNNENDWIEVGDSKALEKVKQSLREMRRNTRKFIQKEEKGENRREHHHGGGRKNKQEMNVHPSSNRSSFPSQPSTTLDKDLLHPEKRRVFFQTRFRFEPSCLPPKLTCRIITRDISEEIIIEGLITDSLDTIPVADFLEPNNQ